jgi:hypothetical protein
MKEIIKKKIEAHVRPAHDGTVSGADLAAKEITLLMLEEKVKAYEEARIIVFRAANEMVAEANLYNKIAEINKEIDSLKKL